MSDGGGPGWLGQGWTRLAVLCLAVLFVGGALGYTIGLREGPPSSAVDVGFLQDMSDHHEQAVTMAIYASEHATDPVVRNFAREVLIFQQYELGIMGTYLGQRGEDRADPERDAMGWMGMPTPVAEMPGMASADDLARLRDARGVDADVLFLELMIEHHRGGLHMAEHAASRARSADIRRLAEVMANNQRGEIGEYQTALARLRAEATAPADQAPAAGTTG